MTTPMPEIDLLDPAALHAARQWADTHDHPQPDDRMLTAYGRVLAAQVRAEQRQQIIADLERRIRSQHLGSTARTWLKYARSVVVVVTDRIARSAGATVSPAPTGQEQQQ